MSAPPDLTALAQADLLLLAARVLAPPPAGSAAVISATGSAEDIDPTDGWALAKRAGIGTGQAVVGTLDAIKSTSAESLLREQCRLFEAVGTCPPSETVYVRRDKGAILADLCGFYRAFGFDHDPASGFGNGIHARGIVVINRSFGRLRAAPGEQAKCCACAKKSLEFHLGPFHTAFRFPL